MNAWREILLRVPRVEELFLPFAIDTNKFSDYERLCALCAVLPLCEDHKIAALVRKAFADPSFAREDARAGADVVCASDLWIAYNRYHGYEEYRDISGICQNERCENSVEKYNNCAIVKLGDPSDLSELSDKAGFGANSYSELVDKIKERSFGKVAAVTIRAERFAAPNRYIAEGVFNRVKRREKCNNIDIGCLYSQLLCEIVSDKKCNCKGVMINVGANVEYARDLVEYMRRYNMHTRIFVGVTVDSDPQALLDMCNTSCGKGIITPVIFVSKNDNHAINKRYMDQLNAVYPSALTERVWI